MSGKQKEMKWESSREMPSSANKPSPLRAEELTKNRSRISPHTLISKTVGRGRLARVINTTCTTGAGRWKRSTKPAAHFHHKTRSKLLIYKLNSQSTLSQWTKTRRYFSWATTPKAIAGERNTAIDSSLPGWTMPLEMKGQVYWKDRSQAVKVQCSRFIQ